jgi:O-antigen ligase
MPSSIVIAALFIVLVLQTGAASIIYATFALLMMRFTETRTQMRVALVLALIVALYPSTRAAGTFPTDDLLDISASFSAERMQSLEFRFDNEDALLERALRRPQFGWGSFGRERVHDPETGDDLSVQDGRWIIWMGKRGQVGFALFFALMLAPVLKAVRVAPKIASRPERVLVSAFCMMVIIQVVDMLPNAGIASLPIFMTGALYGLLQVVPGEVLARRKAERERKMKQRAPEADARSEQSVVKGPV